MRDLRFLKFQYFDLKITEKKLRELYFGKKLVKGPKITDFELHVNIFFIRGCISLTVSRVTGSNVTNLKLIPDFSHNV